MNNDFNKIMSGKSDNELEEYINSPKDFLPSAIEAALEELKLRGRKFSEEELSSVKNKANKPEITDEESGKEPIGVQAYWKSKIVKDESAPAFYSQRAVYAFSLFFGMLFGSILLAINLNQTHDKKGIHEVLSFGFVNMFLIGFLVSYTHSDSSVILFLNITGGLVLNYHFWDKYIGKDLKYRAKPIWIPLLIAIVIIIPIYWLIIF